MSTFLYCGLRFAIAAAQPQPAAKEHIRREQSSRGKQGFLGSLQHTTSHIFGYRGKALDKLLKGVAPLEVFKECANWDACALEDRGPPRILAFKVMSSAEFSSSIWRIF